MHSKGRLRRSMTAIVLATAVVAGTVMPSLAQSPIEVQLLTGRALFTDEVGLKVKTKMDGAASQVVNLDDASFTLTAMFTVQPGAMFPWHSHPGSVVVNVTAGELVYVGSDDCLERRYAAGEAFFDPGFGHVHTAFNRGSVPTVLVATFYGLPSSGPLSNPVTPPAGCVVAP